MAVPWIDPAKLGPPSPPPALVPRRPPDSPVVVVVAGLGFGKTTLLAALSRASEPAIWYGVDVDDASPADFFAGLVAATRRWIPAFEDVAAEAGVPPRGVWQRYFAALGAYNPVGATVALDDFDGAPEAVRQALGELLDRVPAEVRLGVAGRTAPFTTARHEASGRVRVLQSQDLAFTAAELGVYAAGLGLAPAAFAGLEGWPLGVALQATGGGEPGRVAAFLAEAVFDRMTRGDQALARELVGLAEGDWPDPDGLGRLVEVQVLEQLAGGGYRMPAYWQAFLQRVPAPVTAPRVAQASPPRVEALAWTAGTWVESPRVTVPAPITSVPQPLTVRCFGPFEATLGGSTPLTFARRKGTLILAALAMHPRGLPAYLLAELIAGDDPPSPNVLKVTVHALRRALEPRGGAQGESAYVRFADDRYQLAEQYLAAADVRRFETELGAGDRLRDRQPEAARAHYEAALAVYRGEFLEGAYHLRYFEPEREAYRRQAVAAMRWLAARCEARMDDRGAEAWLVQAAQAAPTDEEPYIALMRLHALGRRPDKVRQAYWDARRAFKTLVGLVPGEAVEAAYRAAMATFR